MNAKSKPICVLGIETSCDETGIAIYHEEQGLIANQLHSQIDLHAIHGGVVPELASRDHIRKILPLTEQALVEANKAWEDLTHIAYTAGPGLVGALLVGASVGQSLAMSLGIPAIPVHHMEAHLLAPLLSESQPPFPFLGLLVSGGHTLLVKVDAIGSYKILGESCDDAVGEAFDKTAKLLGLVYPGGPAIAKLAEQGNPTAYDFPRPMMNRPGLDFSFSGLKTFVLNTYEDSDKSDQTKADIAASFQEAVVDTLAKKCLRAVKEYDYKALVIAGGVSANKSLREKLYDLGKVRGLEILFPEFRLCTDNGAMIAFTGYKKLENAIDPIGPIAVKARWPMSD